MKCEITKSDKRIFHATKRWRYVFAAPFTTSKCVLKLEGTTANAAAERTPKV